jgi:hypothetical protein
MSDDVQMMFDVRATDDSQHDANETDNSVESHSTWCVKQATEN